MTRNEPTAGARLLDDRPVGHDAGEQALGGDRWIGTTVVVPTFNESGNVSELVRRLGAACPQGTEVLFVDDSTDDTPDVVRAVAGQAAIPVRLIHRDGDERVGGLAGAVTRGIREARGRWVVVMDGDLQHPPELVPSLLVEARARDSQVVVASRYCGVGGDASGLANAWRRAVSSGSTLLARLAFPRRVGRHCTDPMTGFFAIDREAVDLDRLHPRGFKILLEILARHDLRVAEIPFVFGERFDGESKASWRQGLAFVVQLAGLRFGRVFRLGLVGLTGVVVNLAAMAILIGLGVHYVVAALAATQLAIGNNFLLQERFVFRDKRSGGRSWLVRATQFFAFNNVENLLRVPLLVLLVELAQFPEVAAQAFLLVAAFLARYAFVTAVVYRPGGRPATEGTTPPAGSGPAAGEPSRPTPGTPTRGTPAPSHLS